MNEYRLKVVVVGAANAGKTSIIKRYVAGSVPKPYKPTIGVDFALKVVQVDNKTRVHLQLWDIAGQERFGTMTKIYYKKAVGALVVFDIQDLSSFNVVEKWIADIREKLREPIDIPILLVANKWDKEIDRDKVIPDSQISLVVEKCNLIGYIKTSAKDNININEAIEMKLLPKVMENVHDTPDSDGTVTLGGEGQNTSTTEGICCGFGGSGGGGNKDD